MKTSEARGSRSARVRPNIDGEPKKCHRWEGVSKEEDEKSFRRKEKSEQRDACDRLVTNRILIQSKMNVVDRNLFRRELCAWMEPEIGVEF